MATMPTTATTATTTTTAWLRIIQINDVYELDALPNLKTLIDKASRNEINVPPTTNDASSSSLSGGVVPTTSSDHNDVELASLPDCVLAICAGDFVAPSLLSSLDNGAAMVDCLNRIGIQFACFGNHETDIPASALKKRIEQSEFVWINSNMQDLNNKLGVDTPTHSVVEVGNKRVGLLGLLSTDPGLYRPGSFSNATMEPIIETTRNLVNQLQHLDLIIPLTHQSMPADRNFAQQFTGQRFPIVCGGHDHQPMDEIVAGSRIVKAGMDAKYGLVIDIKWRTSNTCPGPGVPENGQSPSEDVSVAVARFATSDFAPDPEMVQRVEAHTKILHELEKARLFSIRDWLGNQYGSGVEEEKKDQKVVFSTRNNRLAPSTGTTALCTQLRMGMRCQGAIINAGSVRAAKDYDDAEFFTWSDLKAEIPFATKMTAIDIPGHVLESTLKHSRAGAALSPPVARGGYIHTCTSIKYSNSTQSIESIGGEPFDATKQYVIALPAQFFLGIDNHEPLLAWAAENGIEVDEEEAKPAKMIVVEVFSSLIWLNMGSFHDLDQNGDGVITRDEIRSRLLALYGMECVADLVVDTIFSVADLNGNGTITPLEMMIVQFSATDLKDHIITDKELETMKRIAANVLGDNSNDSVQHVVKKIREVVDTSNDGKFNREELIHALGRLSEGQADLLR